MRSTRKVLVAAWPSARDSAHGGFGLPRSSTARGHGRLRRPLARFFSDRHRGTFTCIVAFPVLRDNANSGCSFSERVLSEEANGDGAISARRQVQGVMPNSYRT